MTFDAPRRLTLAVAASVLLHTAMLSPIRVDTAPYLASPFTTATLNVRLPAYPPPGSSDADVPATASEAPATAAPPAETRPDVAALPAESRSPATASANAAGRSPAQSRTSPETGDASAQGKTAVRTALPDEVNVFVHRYDAKAEENPSEVIELPSGKYVYFNAPRLKQAAYPMTDAAPQYPSGKLDYPHGAVILLLFIDEQGRVEKTLAECANPFFEDSAVASIRDMRFSAARDANGPVKSYMKVEFRYGLGNPCGRPPLTPQQVVNPRATR